MLGKLALSTGALLLATAAHAGQARRADFGAMPDGARVEAITLSNARGFSARILSYGAILQSLMVPDARGRRADVVEGYASLDGYLSRPNYFGSSVGRYANRIGGAHFTLDGRAYTLAKNDGPNSLHGGAAGFDRHLWQVVSLSSGPQASVTLRRTSPDGEEGYPGALSVTATYTLDDKGALSITYRATTDAPTIVNLTGHAYFNLGGEASGRSIMDHRIMIPANAYTPVDATLIPTGEIAPVAGTPFDLRKPTAMGAHIRDGDPQLALARGYDHNWAITRPNADRPTKDQHLMAAIRDPLSGRAMEVWSNQPGLQFYTGNFLDGTIRGKGGKLYRQGDAFCVEPQVFPDTPNKPAFGSARLDPGQTYVHRITYRFSAR
ncbi:aldose epimerase family protein [Novosphingobium sediminicola]|uniref:Aldose 1-epimerase n=1 Tax=Novosphingobium sediminicola TaxID=563162 RepID=A0A7W6CEN3_9SPHN|nr:aldose epimerase family protein [Novosphingobium sediminicola]MBB3954437.1 aldose 1-epimerase [Novosphingobium sediminicola]